MVVADAVAVANTRTGTATVPDCTITETLPSAPVVPMPSEGVNVMPPTDVLRLNVTL